MGASVVSAPAVEDEEAAAEGVANPKTMLCPPTDGVGTLSVHTVLLSSILIASISACGISADCAPTPGIAAYPNLTPGVSVENFQTAPL